MPGSAADSGGIDATAAAAEVSGAWGTLFALPSCTGSSVSSTIPFIILEVDSTFNLEHFAGTGTTALRCALRVVQRPLLAEPACPRAAVTKRSALLAGVSRLKLVSNGKNEADVFGREPTVLRDVPVTAAREDELASTLFSGPPEERMISQELKSLSHAQNLFTRLLGILGGDEVNEPFEVSNRLLSYFDRRHARALGRRALAPDARAAR